jgi:ribosomal protein S12 methylthiotransferase accessory factor
MMEITFTGGLKVRAELDGLTVDTDQPIASGGGGEAAGPYDLFLASLGTCAGFFALRFMQQRGIDPTGARLTLATDKDPETGLAATVRIDLELPHDFPDKYRQAIVRAMDQCKVKRQLEHPPVVEASTSQAGTPPSGLAVSLADSATHTSS